MQTEGKSRKLLRIHRDDNVLIVVAPIRPGDRDVIDGHEVVFTQNIAIGHKVAACDIKAGEKVHKCGVPISYLRAILLFKNSQREAGPIADAGILTLRLTLDEFTPVDAGKDLKMTSVLLVPRTRISSMSL